MADSIRIDREKLLATLAEDGLEAETVDRIAAKLGVELEEIERVRDQSDPDKVRERDLKILDFAFERAYDVYSDAETREVFGCSKEELSEALAVLQRTCRQVVAPNDAGAGRVVLEGELLVEHDDVFLDHGCLASQLDEVPPGPAKITIEFPV